MTKQVRRFRSKLGILNTEPARMGDLHVDDRFVGPNESAVYKVTADCASNPNGFLHVWNLTMADQDVLDLMDKHPAEYKDSHPRQGFFAYSTDTLLDRVI